jgi:ABC-type Na+ efflux pump permease subunit
MIALLRLAVLAAGAIAREKEGGTLALLLTTPLDARQIVRGKLCAVVDRGMPWVLAALVVQTVSIACTVDWGQVWVVPCYVVATLVSAFFVTTAGLYFGARLATATAAVVATLGTHLCLRYLVIGHYNPVYIWLWYKIILTPRPSGRTMAFFSVGTFLIVAVLQVGLGLFLLRRAAGTLRRYV